jgi:Fe-S cluster biogenesis protein NfuA
MLEGFCVGCPSSLMNRKRGIEQMLTDEIPEVKEVVGAGSSALNT